MTQDPNVNMLINGCVKGNRTSQLKLYQHFYSYAMSICLPYTKNREEALEVLNDGFLKAFRKIDKFDPDYSFKPWLRRILINASIDYYRKYHKTEKNDLTTISFSTGSTHNLALENLAYEDLIMVMQKLSPSYRLVFNLFVIEGLTHKAIAEKLNISVGTSKSNLVKARLQIQGVLESSHGIYLKPKRNG